jgi:hypothetical protein
VTDSIAATGLDGVASMGESSLLSEMPWRGLSSLPTSSM